MAVARVPFVGSLFTSMVRTGSVPVVGEKAKVFASSFEPPGNPGEATCHPFDEYGKDWGPKGGRDGSSEGPGLAPEVKMDK